MIDPSIVIFDGVCNFCNSAVSFIVKRDPTVKFAFTPMQSTLGQKLLVEYKIDQLEMDTLVLIKAGPGLEEGSCYIWSDAALEIAGDLNGGWRYLRYFKIVPRPIRDFCYKLFARNRYRLFGKTEQCMVPTAEIRSRFIE